MLVRPALIEHVADHRDVRIDSQPLAHVLDLEHGRQASGFETGGEVPVVEYGVEPALLDLLVEQGRGGVDRFRLRGQILSPGFQ